MAKATLHSNFYSEESFRMSIEIQSYAGTKTCKEAEDYVKNMVKNYDSPEFLKYVRGVGIMLLAKDTVMVKGDKLNVADVETEIQKAFAARIQRNSMSPADATAFIGKYSNLNSTIVEPQAIVLKIPKCQKEKDRSQG